MAENSFPTRVNIGGGSKGGTVIIIVGTLFLGYLYFSRRLPNVFKAIATSPDLLQATTMGNTEGVGITPYTPTATAPINPGYTPSIVPPNAPQNYPRSFLLAFPPQYHAGPATIVAADRFSCAANVYNATLAATESLALAEMYVSQYCN